MGLTVGVELVGKNITRRLIIKIELKVEIIIRKIEKKRSIFEKS